MTIRNVCRWARPTSRSVVYRGGTLARRFGRRMKNWMAVGLRVLGAVSMLWTGSVRANPVGEQVVGGGATFERVGNSLTIHQGTDRAAINWNSFSIGAVETTKFVQPSSSSIALNRVIMANPSAIYGSLQSNGQIILANPSGIFVGPGGSVTTGGFFGSTRDVDPETFMKGGDLRFLGDSTASILNQGKVEATAGEVFLIAQHVENEGQIMAKDGTVGLVSGTQVTLQSAGPGHYKVRLIDVPDEAKVKKDENGTADVVNDGVIEAANALIEATGNPLALAIKNTGVIRATGIRPNEDGSVTLTGGEGDVLNQGVIAAIQKNMEGGEQGGSIAIRGKNVTAEKGSLISASGKSGGGKVKIEAKDTTMLAGRIEATGYGDKAKGGRIEALGAKVGLRSGEINADGGAKGGTVLVGGDYQGLNPEVRSAQSVVMLPEAEISARATVNGDGGKVILWSDDYTGFFGSINTMGGVEGGNGGFVETSSKNNLQSFGRVDASGPKGMAGEWLLDPANVTISTAATSGGTFSSSNPSIFEPTSTSATILNTEINSALNSGTSVTIQTWQGSSSPTAENSITVAASILRDQPPPSDVYLSPSGGLVSLILKATGDIVINSTISSTSGKLSLGLLADYNQNGSGSISMNSNLTTLGGDVELSAASLGAFGGTIDTRATFSGGGAYAGNILIHPSVTGATIGVGTGTGTFTVSSAVLNQLYVDGAVGTQIMVMPGTITIGDRGSGALSVGTVTLGINNANLALVTGKTIQDTGVGTAVTTTAGNGIVIVNAAGDIGTSSNSIDLDTTRLGILTEGDRFNITSSSILTQLNVVTDGTVLNQRVVDNVGGTSNLNYFITEGNDPNSSNYQNTSINGVSVRTGAISFRYTNTQGDINVLGGGIAAVQYDSVNINATQVRFRAPNIVGGVQATGTITAGVITITNPGSGYNNSSLLTSFGSSGQAGNVTLTGGATPITTFNYAVAGLLNVQPANNGTPTVYQDMTLSAPKGNINRAVPIYTGGGNLTLQANDLGTVAWAPGSLTLTDNAGTSAANGGAWAGLPPLAYDQLGVVNTFTATAVSSAPAGVTYVGSSFGARFPLGPNQQGLAGAIYGLGGVLSVEAVSSGAEGQPISFTFGGGTANAMNFGVTETALFEGPAIRFGGSQTGDVTLGNLNLAIYYKQSYTTRTSTGPNNQSVDYIPRYFENPFFASTRDTVSPSNAQGNTGVPHVAGGMVSLVSGKGVAKNVSGGDVNLYSLSLTGVNGISFDGQGGSGGYAAKGLDTANNSLLGAISGRVGRTLEDVTIGNGGDASFKLPANTAFIEDGRFFSTWTSQGLPTQLVSAENALGLALITGGSVSSLTPTAGLSRITVTSGGGYQSVPLVAISGGGGQAASGVASMGILAPTFTGISTATAGTYTIPAVGGGGTGGAVDVVVSSTGVITVGPVTPGTGYTSQPTFDVSSLGPAVTATYAPTANFLQVASVSVANTGFNYQSIPTIAFINTGAGTPVTATATSGVGILGGLSYNSTPVVAITAGGVQPASARALLDASGGVALISPQILGDGYTPSVSDGSGGLTGPTVSLSGGGSSGRPNPTVSAEVGNNGRAFVSDDKTIGIFSIQNKGAGYDPLAPPQVVLTGGYDANDPAARPAVARALVSGFLNGATVLSGGLGYDPNNPPQVLIQGGGGGGAKAVAVINGLGQITGINITEQGKGYVSPPTISFYGGTAPTAQAAVSAVLDYGVTGLVIVDPGAKYTSRPTVQICNTGSALSATALVDLDFNPTLFGGQLTPIYVRSSGSGYTSEPTVSIEGGGVTQALARAVVQNDPFSNKYGRVVGYEITDKGAGYANTPNVTVGYGQAYGNFGEYGISTETVDREVGSGNITISNIGAVRVGGMIINAPVRTGDALGVAGSDAVTGSILLNIGGDLSANSLTVAQGGGARGILITGDASLDPTAYASGSAGNARSGSVSITARDIGNNTGAGSILYQITGSEGLPVQIGTASGGVSNLAGSLLAALLLRDSTNTEVGDLQIYAPAPGEIQIALGNVPLDPNHPQPRPRVSNDLTLSGLSTPGTSTDANGNVTTDESLVTIELGSTEGKLTLKIAQEAQATATVVNGRVTLITPDQGGQVYSTQPTVTITGGGIVPAVASVFVRDGSLIAQDGSNTISVGNGLNIPGDGYFTVPTVTFQGGGGAGAQAVAAIDGLGNITTIRITNAGYGYTSLPTVVISAPAGIQGAASATVVNQTISQTTLTVANGGITDPGLGYTTAPLVSVTGGRLGTATATATVDTNLTSSTYSQITAITIQLNGDVFVSGTADITIGAPAQTATATANLSNGLVTSFTINNPGGGYQSSPQVLLSTSTGTSPYTLLGDRTGLIADRIQIFDSTVPSSVLIQTSLAAVAPWTNQRPVSLGAESTGSLSVLTSDLLRFEGQELVVGRRNSTSIGVGAGEITVRNPVSADNLNVSNGIFLAGTRGMRDLGGATGISFPAVSINVGSTVSLTGSGNQMHYLAAAIQGPCDLLSYQAGFTLSSGLRLAGTTQIPVTIGEVFGNPAYFTGQRFNQGITTQNGNVSLLADLIEQTRLVGFVDTTGGGKYPVGTSANTANVTFAPKTADRPISVYYNQPGSGLALRISNPSSLGLEQVKSASITVGSATSGSITLSSDFGFNYGKYPDAPRALILKSAGDVTEAVSQIPPSPQPNPTLSRILVPSLSVQTAGNAYLSSGSYYNPVTGTTTQLLAQNKVSYLAADLTGAGKAFDFTSYADQLTVVDLSAFGGAKGIRTAQGNVTLTANRINLPDIPPPQLSTGGGATIQAQGARVTLLPLGSVKPIILGSKSVSGFSLSDAELNNISAGTLQIGSTASTSSIQINAPITLGQSTLPGISTALSLISGGTIGDTGGTAGISYPGGLRLTSVGAISFTGSGNSFGTVTALSGGNPITLSSTSFSLGTVDGQSGINAGTGANSFVTLQPNIAGTDIVLGDPAAVPNSWGFTSAELNSTSSPITANIVQIGRNDVLASGNMIVNGSIAPVAFSSLVLVTGGSISDSGAGTVIGINISNLSLQAGTLVALLGQNNQVTTLAGKALTSFQFTDNSGSLTISTLPTITGSLSGIDVRPSGNVVLTADDMNILSAIETGSGDITLKPLNDTTNISLNNPSNSLSLDVGELQLLHTSGKVTIGRQTGAGTISLGGSGYIDLSGNPSYAYSLSLRGSSSSLVFNGGLKLASGKTFTIDVGSGAVTSPYSGIDITSTGGTILITSAGSVGTPTAPLTSSVAILGVSTVAGQLNLLNSGSLLVNGAVQAAGNIYLSSSTGLFQNTSAITSTVASGTVTLEGDTLTLSNLVTGTGGIYLQPFTASQAINVFTSGAGGFEVTSSSFENLDVNSPVTIGRSVSNPAGSPFPSNSSGNVQVGAYIIDPSVNLTIQSPGQSSSNTFTVSGSLTNNDKNLTLNAGQGQFATLGTINLGTGAFKLVAGSASLGNVVTANGGVTLASSTIYLNYGSITPGVMSVNASLLSNISTSGYLIIGDNDTGNIYVGGLTVGQGILPFGGLGLVSGLGGNQGIHLTQGLNSVGLPIYINGPLILPSSQTITMNAGGATGGSSLSILGGIRGENGVEGLTVKMGTGSYALTLAGGLSTDRMGLLDLQMGGGSISLGTDGTTVTPPNISSGPIRGLTLGLTEKFTLPTTASSTVSLKGGDISITGYNADLDFRNGNLAGQQNLRLEATGTGNLLTRGINAASLYLFGKTLSFGEAIVSSANATVGGTQSSNFTVSNQAGASLSVTDLLKVQTTAPAGEVRIGHVNSAGVIDGTGTISLVSPVNLSSSETKNYAIQGVSGGLTFSGAGPVLTLPSGATLRLDLGSGAVSSSGGVDYAATGGTLLIDQAGAVTIRTDIANLSHYTVPAFPGKTGPGSLNLVNLGSLTINGSFDTGNNNILVQTLSGNLTLNATMAGGMIQLGAAQNFINEAGRSPFSNRAGGRTLIYSTGQGSNSPYDFSGLNGFGVAFGQGFGSMPGSGNFLVYSSYAQVGLNYGVVYGEMFAGNSTSALLMLPSELFVSVNGLMIPKVRAGGYLEYYLYPQRVDPEGVLLPPAAMGQLEKELGRPPTVQEMVALEARERRKKMMRTGAILERSSFDAAVEEENSGREIRADRPETKGMPVEGGKPQAEVLRLPATPTAQKSDLPAVAPQARNIIEVNKGAHSPLLRPGPTRSVALRDENENEVAQTRKILEEERVRAEVGVAQPVADRY